MPIVGFKRKQMTLSHDICDTLFEDAYCQLKETARSCTNDVPPHSDFSNNVLGSYSNLRLFFTRPPAHRICATSSSFHAESLFSFEVFHGCIMVP